jgi:hypothetical protein
MAEDIAHKGLLEPILEQGIRNTHFFNGRLLTAEDLRVEQAANRQQHRQLGQAIGEGVAYGLEVEVAAGSTAQRPVIRVTRGLALNRRGEAVELPADVDVALVREAQAQATEAGLFADCALPPAHTSSLDVGFYLFTARPTSGFKGRAPMVSLTTPGVATGCGSRHAVEGVKFCLLPLTLASSPAPSLSAELVQLASQLEAQLNQLPLLSGTPAEQLRREIAANVSKLRNGVAYLCFGAETLADFPADPFARTTDDGSPYVEYGAPDELRRQGSLTDSDVPLALLYWTAHGVQFIDMWAVRRRSVPPLVEDLWPLHVGQRRPAEAEAMFLQFQRQILDIVLQQDNLSSVIATRRFRYLPPAGYLPLGTGSFSRDVFFQGLDVERVQVDAVFLRLLIQQSWFLEPIDLAEPAPLRLYEAPENMNYLVFMRRERQPEPSPPEAPPAPGTTPSTGRIDVDIDVGDTIRASVAARLALTGGGRLREGVDIKVWAEDELGNQYPARFVRTRSGLTLIGRGEFEFDRGLALFTIRAIPAGTYTVKARLKGFKEASRSAKLNAGQTLRVVLRLVQEGKKPGGRIDPPTAPGKGDWIKPSWYDKIAVLDKYIKWPWPPEEVFGFDPVVDPPPFEVQEWMQAWGDWVKLRHSEAPVNPGDIGIYIDQSHTPDATPQNPYAYLVFGDGGAYIPVALTPRDRTLDRPTPVSKGELAGIDRDVEDRLKAVGLSDLDVLAASWQGLVADAMGVSVAAAGGVIGEARRAADDLQSSLRLFSGVDRTLEDRLRAAGITDAVVLANADPQTLATQLGTQGVTQAFAQRLVDEARQAVPISAWSLSAANLGLKDQEIATLNALNITTQGQLKSRTADQAQLAEIASAVGISTSALGTLVGGIDLMRLASDFRGTRVRGAPVTSVVGVNRDAAKALARLNIATMHDLALSDINIVAEAFGGDVAKATEAINTAKGTLGL